MAFWGGGVRGRRLWDGGRSCRVGRSYVERLGVGVRDGGGEARDVLMEQR